MEDQANILNERYQLLARAGSGGMSVVYRAHDLALGRIVAVKVLHESLTSDGEFLHRFQKEAHSVANLSHPSIVTVHDIGQVLSVYNALIVARTTKHQTCVQLAESAAVPVINAMTDLLHPCQLLADAFTLKELGRLSPERRCRRSAGPGRAY